MNRSQLSESESWVLVNLQRITEVFVMILEIRHFELVRSYSQLIHLAVARRRVGFPRRWNDLRSESQAALSEQSKQPVAAHQHEHGQRSAVWRVDQSPAGPSVYRKSSPLANAITAARAARTASRILAAERPPRGRGIATERRNPRRPSGALSLDQAGSSCSRPPDLRRRTPARTVRSRHRRVRPTSCVPWLRQDANRPASSDHPERFRADDAAGFPPRSQPLHSYVPIAEADEFLTQISGAGATGYERWRFILIKDGPLPRNSPLPPGADRHDIRAVS